MTDCDSKSETCAEGGNWASHDFAGSTVDGIKSGRIRHHLTIDYWFSKGESMLVIFNLKLLGGDSFA